MKTEAAFAIQVQLLEENVFYLKPNLLEGIVFRVPADAERTKFQTSENNFRENIYMFNEKIRWLLGTVTDFIEKNRMQRKVKARNTSWHVKI